jgi:hypothetical protein
MIEALSMLKGVGNFLVLEKLARQLHQISLCIFRGRVEELATPVDPIDPAVSKALVHPGLEPNGIV